MTVFEEKGWNSRNTHTVEDDVCCVFTAECWNIEAPTWTHVLQTPSLTPLPCWRLWNGRFHQLSQHVAHDWEIRFKPFSQLIWIAANVPESRWMPKPSVWHFAAMQLEGWWRFAVTLTATLLDFSWSAADHLVHKLGRVVVLLRSLCEQLWTTVLEEN